MTAFNASLARQLGGELAAARLLAGYKQVEVARQLGRHPSVIGRWERGERLPSENDVSAMLALYEVTGTERDRLLQMARDASHRNWVVSGMMNKELAALIQDEKAARRIITIQPLLIPGLCQTDRYAHAIVVGAGATPSEADQRTLERMGRQALLTSDNAPEYTAVILEHALRNPPCSDEVMAGQLRKLLNLGKLPNVSIRVLPNRVDGYYTAAVEGSIVVMEFERTQPVVQQERYLSTTTITEPREVRSCQTAADEILRKAMNEADSADFIARLLQQIEKESRK